MKKNREYEKAAFDTLKLLTRQQQTKTELIENTKGKHLTEEKAIHKRWTECCTELCNYKLRTNARTLKNEDSIENREKGEASIHEEEVEKAKRMWKNGKSPGVDNIPAEFLKYGGPTVVKAFF